MLMPDEGSYFSIANTVTLPAEFGESFPFVTTVPVMVRLREHHCIRPARAVEVPIGDDADRLFDEGVRNGWLPGGVKFREDGVSSVLIFSLALPYISDSVSSRSRTSMVVPSPLMRPTDQDMPTRIPKTPAMSAVPGSVLPRKH